MKINRPAFWPLPLLLLALLLGCAAQSTDAQTASSPSLTLRPDKPLLLSGVTPESIDAQEEALLEEDDLNEWDNENLEIAAVADPLERFNRIMFQFNDKFYFYLLKPVVVTYRTLTPEVMRTGIRNFFTNLLFPIRLINNILQGKGQAAEAELAKFIYNSTVGVLGFGNPAKEYPKLNPDPEDLGQTLGKYGVGDGFYIVWPFVGPSTLRDSVGLLGNSVANPITYVEPVETSLVIKGYDYFNRLSIFYNDLQAFNEAAFDPYEAARDLYIQSRHNRIKQ